MIIPGFIGFMCFVDWFYERFYDGLWFYVASHDYAHGERLHEAMSAALKSFTSS